MATYRGIDVSVWQGDIDWQIATFTNVFSKSRETSRDMPLVIINPSTVHGPIMN